jgi:hypothetical protein
MGLALSFSRQGPITMTTRPPQNRLVSLIFLAALASVVTAGGRGAPTKAGRTTALDPPGPTRFIFGARHCGHCHDQKNDPTDKPEDSERWICRMDESRTFDQRDKHKLAFAALTGPRGLEMSKSLGTDVSKSGACLNCHSLPARGSETREYVPETDGVTCVACHGAREEWVEKHVSASKEWRNLDPHDKERQFGMIDLREPVRRAEICASCHIGNRDEGKVVTHAMYAAGHPPLPGFEMVTFSDAQPRHWQNVREKTPERQRLLKGLKPARFEQTQLVAVSGLVVLRQWMRLLADESTATRPGPLGVQWPDFARFDCSACHHDLQAQNGVSWRQVRRRDGHPGRPTAPEWPWILFRLGIEAADTQQAALPDIAFEQLRAEFDESMNVRPFGDPESFVPAARKTAAWADTLLETLSQKAMDAGTARKLLDRLCKMAGENIPDYDSARQIAWAFRVIYHESVPDAAKPDPLIEHVLEDLDAELALNLPSAKQQVPIEKTLESRLRVVAEFDPGFFQAHFDLIAQRLNLAKPATAVGH